ncbi:uncharacterized protein E0L32_009197 [Thyridium curvatum]|uniref:SPIN90/Ldb17 leucine-rich domain-containing protein n=1 Tax=Thyridium curvatum TaxID=1093900 RepID=A0A507ASC2_9PEZI|nr:uncharacterized protein E0L32_009197 [Thyridium curvatum]TPX09596.1 hypothetical protein E0L32_009197 [Thyridium curvatum]
MSDNEAAPSVGSEEQFWDDLGGILSAPCSDHESIDDALRSWLSLVSTSRDQYLSYEDDVATCSQKLLDSPIFVHHRDYVRTQIIYSLLQEDEIGPLHVIANFLLLDGRTDEDVFRRMIDEGCFARLVDLVKDYRDNDRRLHRLLLELTYEMSRIERVRTDDLLHVDDALVMYLFQLIEDVSDDADDPYHYPIIRVLLVLNEQYMVATTTAAADPSSPTAPMTNRVIKVLSIHGPRYRTFGENIILLLNRETETSLQLLILKLLYLLFTTTATYEYFYTNDLRVLLDVIIRNLLDLPNELMSLRHTYLRVLYPLLAHTQLSHPPHYKREEIIKVLAILGGVGNLHFAPADETTLRLVDRVSKVKWLADTGDGDVARKLLGISLSNAQAASSMSVVDVAAVMEKPGVKTPSRKTGSAPEAEDSSPDTVSSPELTGSPTHTRGGSSESVAPPVRRPRKALPAVPKHRHGVPVITATAPTPSAPALEANGKGHKKLPPKAPPPRRGARLRQATSSTNLCAADKTLHSAETAPVS